MSAHSELTTVRTTARCHAQMYLAVSYASVLLGIPGTESLVPVSLSTIILIEKKTIFRLKYSLKILFKFFPY